MKKGWRQTVQMKRYKKENIQKNELILDPKHFNLDPISNTIPNLNTYQPDNFLSLKFHVIPVF